MLQRSEKMSGHDGTWCLVSIGDEKVKAKIMHTGRGKYRIVEDEGGRHANKKIDASDVFHCKFEPAQYLKHQTR